MFYRQIYLTKKSNIAFHNRSQYFVFLLFWLVGWFWLVDYMFGWMVGWVLGRLVGWMVGWFLAAPSSSRSLVVCPSVGRSVNNLCKFENL